MPIPGSRLSTPGSSVIDPSEAPADFYPSLCTFLAPTVVTANDGQKVNTFAAIDAAHTDLACRLVPMILLRPVNQEHRTFQQTVAEAPFHLTIASYVADVQSKWQCSVDGSVYQVIAIEADGNHKTSRIGLDNIKPFNPKV